MSSINEKMLLIFKHEECNYQLRSIDDEDKIELLAYMGHNHDKIENLDSQIKGKEKILNFLTMRNIPENKILAVKKVFQQHDL